MRKVYAEEIIIEEDRAMVPLNRTQKVKNRKYALIDLDDVDTVLNASNHWFMISTGYVGSYKKVDDINIKYLLNRVILGLDYNPGSGNDVATYIDGNRLNNRKSNLIMLSNRENINRNVISNTGLNNITRKPTGHYQINFWLKERLVTFGCSSSLHDSMIIREVVSNLITKNPDLKPKEIKRYLFEKGLSYKRYTRKGFNKVMAIWKD